MWLLDTNTCIRFLNPEPSPVKTRLANVRREQVFLCDVVKFELNFGAFNSQRRAHNLGVLDAFLQPWFLCRLTVWRRVRQARFEPTYKKWGGLLARMMY